MSSEKIYLPTLTIKSRNLFAPMAKRMHTLMEHMSTMYRYITEGLPFGLGGS